MGQVIPRQHPEVVLRRHFKAVRTLLAVALVAIAALAATVVILATDDDNDSATISAQPNAQQQQVLPPGTRFDGGPDEGTRGLSQVQPQTLPPGARFDGGPDEGSRGLSQVQPQTLPPGARFDGGPDEGSRGPQAYSYWESSKPRTSYQPTPNEGFKERAGGPAMLPTGPSSSEQADQQQPGTRP
jgi:hypothetical protein